MITQLILKWFNKKIMYICICICISVSIYLSMKRERGKAREWENKTERGKEREEVVIKWIGRIITIGQSK